MPIWHQSPKLTPRYFLETPRLFGYPKNAELNRSAFFVYIHIKYYLKLQYSFLNYVRNV